MWQLTSKEFEAVTGLDAARRVEYAVKRMADTGEIWMLRERDLWKISKLNRGARFSNM